MFYKIIRGLLKITTIAFVFKNTKFVQTLMDKRFDPATIRLPEIHGNMESNIPGVHLIGDISGTPLLKNGMNMGYEIVDELKDELIENHKDDLLDLLIVGSGGSGLSAALKAKEHGISNLIIEQGHEIAQTIQNFSKGKIILAEPVSVPAKGKLFLTDETTKEELLEKWEKQVKEESLNINFNERVIDLQNKEDHIVVKTNKNEYKAQKVFLAIGKAGNPRKIGCPGDDLPKTSHFLADPDLHNQEDIVIYGGGDVAMEAAISLAENNKVTIATIDKELTFPRKRNKDKVFELQKEGKIDLLLNTKVTKINEENAELQDLSTKDKREIKNNRLFTMIGADLPLKFFEKIGLKLERTWNLKRWLYLLSTFILVYTIYAVDKGKFLPFIHGQKISSWLRSATGFAGYDWYAFAYTIVMVVFGSFAAVRWAKTSEFKNWTSVKKKIKILSGIILFLIPPALLLIISRSYLGTEVIGKSLGSWTILIYILSCITVTLINIKMWTNLKWDRIKMQGWRFGALLFIQILLFGLGSVYASGKIGNRTSKKWASHSYKIVYNGPLSPNAVIAPYVNAKKALNKKISENEKSDSTPGFLESVSAKVFIFALAFTFFLIPLLTLFFGKAFCTWICGCGGLAETLGDKWRHYSPKGKKSIALETQGLFITIIVFVLMAWMLFRAFTIAGSIDPRYSGLPGSLYKAYLVVVDWWLIGIIPVALYPFFGGKVWCRYWCPLAKYMQVSSKIWRKLGIGRYKIKSVHGCITCGQCSKYCQVGIDVETFAKNEMVFDNQNSSCIACGICISVCPMDILSFDLKKDKKAS